MRFQPRHRLAEKPSSTQTTATARKRGVDLFQVNASDTGNDDTDIDIIAIHDLDTNSTDTWVYETDNHEKINWLANPDMLPKKAARARIFCCDWPADLFERSDLRQKTLDEFSRLLLAGIKRRQPPATNDPRGYDRPIVFIASCFGGVLLMKALIIANNSGDGHYLPLRKATRGIVFLATPFRGSSSFTDIAAWALVQGRKLSQLLNEVKNSFHLENLIREFTQLCIHENHPFQVASFYELSKMSLLRKGLLHPLARFAKKRPLVGKGSAILDIDQDPLALDRSHVMMNKFSDLEDPDYKSVAGKIEEMLGNIRENSPLQQAGARIRKEIYTGDRLKIERLSGKSLPMDQCYINVAIVEQPGGIACGLQDAVDPQQSSQFSTFCSVEGQQTGQKGQHHIAYAFQPL